MSDQQCHAEKAEKAEKSEKSDKLAAGCAQLGIALSAAHAQQLHAHLGLLAKWNRHLNLTAVENPDDMVVRHLLDCLAIAPFVRGDSLLDVGSGAGFPGLPLAIINPQLDTTLLDSRSRRIEFLRHSCAALGLNNVSVERQRVEDYRPAVKFGTLAVRAFASLGDTLNATAALHHPGGRLLAMKGKMPAQEIAHLDPAWRERMTVEKLHVPFLSAERHLIIVEF